MKRLAIVFVMLFLAGVIDSVAEMRVWTSVQNTMVEAEFVSMMGTKVVLKKADGKTIKVPVTGLCKGDQEFLASMIPPKLKIDVDIDKERSVLSSKTRSNIYGFYTTEKKAESFECIVEIEKINKEATNKAFRGYVFLLGQNIDSKRYKILDVKEHAFDFKASEKVAFNSDTVTVEYTDCSYNGKSGWQFEGYLVYVVDGEGQIVAIETGTSSFANNLVAIRKASEGDLFAKNFKKIE